MKLNEYIRMLDLSSDKIIEEFVNTYGYHNLTFEDVNDYIENSCGAETIKEDFRIYDVETTENTLDSDIVNVQDAIKNIIYGTLDIDREE